MLISNSDNFNFLSIFHFLLHTDGYSYNLQRTKVIMADRQIMVEQKLKCDKAHWTNVKCDQRLVLYPLVRAINLQLGVNCTFSFGTGLFVEANYLIKDYIKALPIGEILIHDPRFPIHFDAITSGFISQSST